MRKVIVTIIYFALLSATLSLPLPAKLGCRIAGVVVDKDTGEPVGGANIYIRQRERFSKCLTWQRSFDLTTDAFGRFSQLLDHRGSYKVYCQSGGYVTFKPDNYSYLNGHGNSMTDSVFDVAEGEVKFLRIELERGGTLLGTITIETGEKIPLGPIKINLYRKIPGDDENATGRAIISTIINAAGVFKIDDLKAGDGYLAYVYPGDGFPRKKIENISIVKNSVTDISATFLLPLDTCIQGHVKIKSENDLNGVVWIQIVSTPLPLKTEEAHGFCEGVQILNGKSGEYCIKGLQPGLYRIGSVISNGSENWLRIEDAVQIEKGRTIIKDLYYYEEKN